MEGEILPPNGESTSSLRDRILTALRSTIDTDADDDTLGIDDVWRFGDEDGFEPVANHLLVSWNDGEVASVWVYVNGEGPLPSSR